MRCPQGGGWICVQPPSPVLNPAVRKKEATMVAGLVTMILGVAIAMTRCCHHPSMMEAVVHFIVAAIVTVRNIYVMTLNEIGGGGEDNVMSYLLHAAWDLCNATVIAEIDCDKCNIAAMLQRQQFLRDCRDVTFVACNRSDAAFVACNKCNIKVTANLKVYHCQSS